MLNTQDLRQWCFLHVNTGLLGVHLNGQAWKCSFFFFFLQCIYYLLCVQLTDKMARSLISNCKNEISIILNYCVFHMLNILIFFMPAVIYWPGNKSRQDYQHKPEAPDFYPVSTSSSKLLTKKVISIFFSKGH